MYLVPLDGKLKKVKMILIFYIYYHNKINAIENPSIKQKLFKRITTVPADYQEFKINRHKINRTITGKVLRNKI